MNIKKILLPYQQINKHLEYDQYARYNLHNDGFLDYIVECSLGCWKVISHNIGYFSPQFDTLQSKEIAMKKLDNLLINGGYILLDDWGVVDRYGLLL
jgi:hypothetical protein